MPQSLWISNSVQHIWLIELSPLLHRQIFLPHQDQWLVPWPHC
jgi:hypothetical protein